jgi:hypothetical protein
MKEIPFLNPVSEILDSIRTTLSQAQNASDRGDDDAEYLVERAFVAARLLLEAAGLFQALNTLRETQEKAQKNYAESAYSDVIGEPYLIWSSHLYHYLVSISVLFGEPKAGTVSKEIVEILRATQYSITDPKCFPLPPQNETDVHVRIEAVLRCIFPDLLTKPRVTKQIKHFEPDTGLPSIRTLIEYKFISTSEDARRISDELLADTRGYVSKEWDKVIYVIYETKRVKPEKQWNQLLRSSDVGSNTSIVVIHGEQPATRRTNRLPKGRSSIVQRVAP